MTIRDWDYWMLMAESQILCEDYVGAESSYREALKLKPDDKITWYNLGQLLSKQGKHDEAQSTLEKALHLEKKELEVTIDANAPKESVSTLEELRDLSENAFSLLNEGKYQETIPLLREVLKIAPFDYSAIKALKISLRNLNDSTSDVSCYHCNQKTTISIYNIMPWGIDRFGLDFLRHASKYGEILDSNIVSECPHCGENTVFNFTLCTRCFNGYWSESRFKDAEPIITGCSACEFIPSLPMKKSVNEWAVFRYLLEQSQPSFVRSYAQMKAQERIQKQIKVILDNPAESKSWIILGSELLKQYRYEEAEEILLHTMNMDSSNIDIWVDLGFTLLYQQKLKEAEVIFRQATSMSRENERAWYGLYEVLDQLDEPSWDVLDELMQIITGKSSELTQSRYNEMVQRRRRGETGYDTGWLLGIMENLSNLFGMKRSRSYKMSGLMIGYPHVDETSELEDKIDLLKEQIRRCPYDRDLWMEYAEILEDMMMFNESTVVRFRAEAIIGHSESEFPPLSKEDDYLVVLTLMSKIEEKEKLERIYRSHEYLKSLKSSKETTLLQSVLKYYTQGELVLGGISTKEELINLLQEASKK